MAHPDPLTGVAKRMVDLAEITALEARDGEWGAPPVLGQAYRLLLERWRGGERDRETALRLLFLAWYACAAPAESTGLPDDGTTRAVFREVFGALGGAAADDPELLAAVALMTRVAPACLGDSREWSAIGVRCAARAPRLGLDLPPERFAGRGTYGKYFEHQARLHQWSGPPRAP